MCAACTRVWPSRVRTRRPLGLVVTLPEEPLRAEEELPVRGVEELVMYQAIELLHVLKLICGYANSNH